VIKVVAEHSQGVCPKCKSANFVQTHYLTVYECKDCGARFKLVEVT